MKSCVFNSIVGPRRYDAKWNKSDRDKQHLISLTCRIQQMNKRDKTKNKNSLRCREPTGDCQREGVRDGETDEGD